VLVHKNTKKTGKQVVEGIVIPAKWDDDGNVTGVTIHTARERVYSVAETRTGAELLGLIHKTVAASGKLRERLDGSIVINVQAYKIIDASIENSAVAAGAVQELSALATNDPL